MNPMAVAHTDGGPVRQPSFHDRQFGLYATRKPPPDALTLSLEADDRVPSLPNISPLPVSARWDSLANGSHFVQSPTSPRHPPNMYVPPHDRPASQPQSPVQLQHPRPQRQQPHPPPLSPPANYSYDMSSVPYDTRSEPPSRPLTAKSSIADMRSDGVANFSRPRKQSIRGPTPEPVKPRLGGFAAPVEVLQDLPSAAAPQTPPWQRSSGPSMPSMTSSPTSIFSPALPTPTTEPPELRNSRARPPYSAYQAPGRPNLGYSRVDSSASAPAASGAAPWLGGDEPRSSFRSQLTSSTGPGTAATERSSVLTKGSSVPSVHADPEEPSLEDVMGMYEKGFDDDDTDGEDDYDSRPVTAHSTSGRTPSAVDAMDEDLVTLQPPRSNLDAEIRRSKLIFSSPAFISSVPHMASNYNYEYHEDKRDSAKSLDSEPSATSDPPTKRNSMLKPPSDSIPGLVTPEPTPTTSTPSRPASASPPPTTPSPMLSPNAIPTEPPEEPGSRDRYGFKKQNQYITRQQYDSWDKGYSEYLSRRRKKWVAYLKDNALMTDGPNRFPAPNPKTKRFVRKGIPPDWRGAAWFYYAGGPAILAKHSGLYGKLLHLKAKRIDIEAIERDLHRTFPDNIKFKPASGGETASSSGRGSQSTMTGSSSGEDTLFHDTDNEPPMITSLRRVLYAFSVYNPRIGYCQSLNFIAGMLLLFVETEEQCFWLLNVITHIYLPGTHEMSLEGSKVDLGVLMSELRDTMPAVWDKIGGELEAEPQSRPQTSRSVRRPMPTFRRKDQPGLSTERLPPITLCMTAWFMSCFIGTLPTETTLRVWDVFFYEGSKTMFRIALAIFKLGESEIRAVSDPMEMFGVVQTMPRRLIDANALMEACFKRRNGFGHLSQETIEERRQERRAQTLQDQEQAANGVAVEPEVRRKGTLFGKRRAVSRTRSKID